MGAVIKEDQQGLRWEVLNYVGMKKKTEIEKTKFNLLRDFYFFFGVPFFELDNPSNSPQSQTSAR